ncbi:MAG: sodium:proton antiporter NhaD [Bacteroidetes bacterium]|nr:sodium:proton antiporter NhaD [Bacteroidota bacterium]
MQILLISIFVIGYLAIALEHTIKLNKAASALLTGVLCWAVLALTMNTTEGTHAASEKLVEHLGELSGILFFLMGAMTIVELIDAHDGFMVITDKIKTANARKMLWIIALVSFVLSAVLDNLTTAIVMVSLLKKLIDDKKTRLLFVGIVVIACNSGGAWSPIGDVTTTMLWIGGQITSTNIMLKLILPSLVCLLVPLSVLTLLIKGNVTRPIAVSGTRSTSSTHKERNLVFFAGLGSLLFTPIFKSITHLPPFMGVLFGLGILWIITEYIHHGKNEEDKDNFSVVHALRKIDVPSILFFLGILMAISALQTEGILSELAMFMNTTIGDNTVIVLLIGLLSAIVDNVPLVAATMGMYDLATFPTDSFMWEFIAYCAGTGGSILIIGSAAGVAAMGIEKIDFMWYLKKIGWLAALGYFSGALVYIGQSLLGF